LPQEGPHRFVRPPEPLDSASPEDPS